MVSIEFFRLADVNSNQELGSVEFDALLMDMTPTFALQIFDQSLNGQFSFWEYMHFHRIFRAFQFGDVNVDTRLNSDSEQRNAAVRLVDTSFQINAYSDNELHALMQFDG